MANADRLLRPIAKLLAEERRHVLKELYKEIHLQRFGKLESMFWPFLQKAHY